MSPDVTPTHMTALLGGIAITNTTTSLTDALDAIPGILYALVIPHA